MMLVPYILLIAGLGVIAGLAAQRFLPGRASVGFIQVASIGASAAVVGGLVGWYAFQTTVVGFAVAVLLTLGLVHLLRNPRQASAG